MRLPFFLFALAASTGAAPMVTAQSDPAAEYRACLSLALEDPAEALETAGRWLGLGGGTAAKHCQASALAGLGEHESAALMLEELVEQSREDLAIKVGMLRQAAAEWLSAEQAPRALAVLDAAAKLAPEDAGVLEDRALVRAELGQFWEAVDDLNAALDQDPRRPSALILRAAAYRKLEAPDLAMVDLDRALQLDPSAADAYLERGVLKLADGDRAGARQDWIAVLQLAPEGPAGDAARAHLERLDVKVD